MPQCVLPQTPLIFDLLEAEGLSLFLHSEITSLTFLTDSLEGCTRPGAVCYQSESFSNLNLEEVGYLDIWKLDVSQWRDLLWEEGGNS